MAAATAISGICSTRPQEKQPAQPASLLRHMGADARHWPLDLRYFQGQTVPVYAVTSVDLEDDRWVVRAWHADRWLRALQCFFAAKDITMARPGPLGVGRSRRRGRRRERRPATQICPRFSATAASRMASRAAIEDVQAAQ